LERSELAWLRLFSNWLICWSIWASSDAERPGAAGGVLVCDWPAPGVLDELEEEPLDAELEPPPLAGSLVVVGDEELCDGCVVPLLFVCEPPLELDGDEVPATFAEPAAATLPLDEARLAAGTLDPLAPDGPLPPQAPSTVPRTTKSATALAEPLAIRFMPAPPFLAVAVVGLVPHGERRLSLGRERDVRGS
jgi:hypothetical protein